jgi:hypothetical protein
MEVCQGAEVGSELAKAVRPRQIRRGLDPELAAD